MKDKNPVGVCCSIYISIWNINCAEERVCSVLYEAANAVLLSGQAAVESSDPGGKTAQSLVYF